MKSFFQPFHEQYYINKPDVKEVIRDALDILADHKEEIERQLFYQGKDLLLRK